MGKIRELLGLGKVRRSKLDDDETEDIIRQIEREEARRLRLAKIREYRLEAEGRLKELEKKLREMEEGGRSSAIQEKFGSLIITPADVEAAKAIAKLPEAEQQRIIGILTALKTPAEKMGMGLHPLTALVLANLGKGGTPEDVTSRVLKDMKAFKEVMGGGKGEDLGSTLVGLAEVIKALKPEKGGGESSLAEKLALEYIKTLGEAVKNRKGWLEEVLEDPKKLEAIKTILGASGQTSPEVMEILRRMEMDRRRWDLALKKLEWEKELKEKQLMAERLRAKEISNGIKKALGAAAGALAEIPSETIRRAPPELEKEEAVEVPGMETVICDRCGAEIPVAPDAVEIICPGCGQRYRRGEVGGTKTEEKAEQAG